MLSVPAMPVGVRPPSLIMEAVYHPVFACHQTRVNPPYICPAVRVTLGIGAEFALFPLSIFELGEVWTREDELQAWEVEPVDGR